MQITKGKCPACSNQTTLRTSSEQRKSACESCGETLLLSDLVKTESLSWYGPMFFIGKFHSDFEEHIIRMHLVEKGRSSQRFNEFGACPACDSKNRYRPANDSYIYCPDCGDSRFNQRSEPSWWQMTAIDETADSKTE